MILKAFSFAALFILVACSSRKNITSVATKTPTVYIQNISVDGNAADWQKVMLSADPANNFQYALANSNSHLYVVIKIQDRIQQMKFLRGGMQLWIDPTGKKNKTIAVSFPQKGELSVESRPMPDNGQKPDQKEFRKQVASQLISLNRIGFKPDYTGVQSIFDNTGFKAAINWDENDVLVYELMIPFAAFGEDISRSNLDVAFELNAVDWPKNNEGGARTNSEYSGGGRTGGHMGGSGGGRGYGGSGMRGSRNSEGAGSRPMQKMYESESFWTGYTMAAK